MGCQLPLFKEVTKEFEEQWPGRQDLEVTEPFIKGNGHAPSSKTTIKTWLGNERPFIKEGFL